MSFKTKALAGVTALGVIGGGLGVATAATAHAATPPCGNACSNYSNYATGGVLDVFKANGRLYQKIIQWGPSYGDKAEDFAKSQQGTVHQFYKAGLVSSAVNLHYGSLEAFELEYTPYGAPTGLCIGAAKTAADGTPVILQSCGTSAKTIWIEDTRDAGGNYLPLINGSDRNFSHPFVMTNSNGNVVTRNLHGFFGSGITVPNQLWAEANGVL